jgi:chloramphenicol 3-O phosphotransferase
MATSRQQQPGKAAGLPGRLKRRTLILTTMQHPFTISPGKIIIINGPSSSGKTTLALAIQKQLDMPFIRFSFDLFLDHKAFPLEEIRSGKFSWEQMRPSVFRGIHRCLPALAIAGNNIIFDHIIETKAWLYELVSLIAKLDVFFVGLHCSLPELQRRELLRGDRRTGEARQDFQTVHSIPTYDLEINSEHPLEENVRILIESWKGRKRPSALDKMIEELRMYRL